MSHASRPRRRRSAQALLVRAPPAPIAYKRGFTSGSRRPAKPTHGQPARSFGFNPTVRSPSTPVSFVVNELGQHLPCSKRTRWATNISNCSVAGSESPVDPASTGATVDTQVAQSRGLKGNTQPRRRLHRNSRRFVRRSESIECLYSPFQGQGKTACSARRCVSVKTDRMLLITRLLIFPWPHQPGTHLTGTRADLTKKRFIHELRCRT